MHPKGNSWRGFSTHIFVSNCVALKTLVGFFFCEFTKFLSEPVWNSGIHGVFVMRGSTYFHVTWKVTSVFLFWNSSCQFYLVPLNLKRRWTVSAYLSTLHHSFYKSQSFLGWPAYCIACIVFPCRESVPNLWLSLLPFSVPFLALPLLKWCK